MSFITSGAENLPMQVGLKTNDGQCDIEIELIAERFVQGLSATNQRHPGGHDGHEQHVGFKR